MYVVRTYLHISWKFYCVLYTPYHRTNQIKRAPYRSEKSNVCTAHLFHRNFDLLNFIFLLIQWLCGNMKLITFKWYDFIGRYMHKSSYTYARHKHCQLIYLNFTNTILHKITKLKKFSVNLITIFIEYSRAELTHSINKIYIIIRTHNNAHNINVYETQFISVLIIIERYLSKLNYVKSF